MTPKLACDWEDRLARMLHLCEQIEATRTRSNEAADLASELLVEAEDLTQSVRAELIRRKGR